jgi:hypothetical protein
VTYRGWGGDLSRVGKVAYRRWERWLIEGGKGGLSRVGKVAYRGWGRWLVKSGEVTY